MSWDDLIYKVGGWFVGILLTVMLAFVAMFLYAAATGNTPEQRHYRECLADGEKEYVCWALIYGGNHGRVK